MSTIATVQPKEIEAIEQEFHPLVEQARKFKVTDQQSAEQASKFVKQVNDGLKSIEGKRVEYTKPMVEAQRTINNDFKQLKEPLEFAKKTVTDMVLGWRAEEERKAAAEEERRRKIQEAHAAKGHEVSAPAYVPKPMKTVGNIQTRKVWVYEVTDETKVPRQFLAVNDAAVKAAMKAGDPSKLQIPGIEFEQESRGAVV